MPDPTNKRAQTYKTKPRIEFDLKAISRVEEVNKSVTLNHPELNFWQQHFKELT